LYKHLKKFSLRRTILKIDLHVHSKYSHDSKSDVMDIINAAKKAGINGVAITDHNSFEGSKEALDICPPDFTIVPGAEYSSDKGHILTYFIKQGLENILNKDSRGVYKWQEIISAAKEQGALVFLAHPFRLHKQVDTQLLQEVDGIEVYNCRAALCSQIEANKKAIDEALKYKKVFSAGSDGHWLGEIGKAFFEIDDKLFEQQPDRTAIIRQALLDGCGRVYGSATTRLYEPASQILDRIKGHTPGRLPKPVFKMGYSLIMEAGRLIGTGKKPLEGWFDLRD
jgi:predicted metal-dependent phosphoesterase TrpH